MMIRKIIIGCLLLGLVACGSVTKPNTFVSGTVASAAEVNANFDTLYTLVNGNIDNANVKGSAGIVFSKLDSATVAGVDATQTLTNKTLTSPSITTPTISSPVLSGTATGTYTLGGTPTITSPDINGGTFDGVVGGTTPAAGTFTTLTADNIVVPSLPPIGTIIPFYDFNAALTFDATYWAYCDGSTKTIAGSSYTLPDLSNRYLVGFGTEAGGDIDTEAWATAAVGNASHQVDISHTHGAGTLQFTVAHFNIGNLSVYFYNQDGSERNAFKTYRTPDTGAPSVSSPYDFDFTNGLAYTKKDSGSGSVASGLSSTQSIQPRSVRVRYLMRIK